MVKAMVRFAYTGAVDSTFLRQRGVDLLTAAHKVRGSEGGGGE